MKPDLSLTALVDVRRGENSFFKIFYKSHGYPEGKIGMARFIASKHTDDVCIFATYLLKSRYKYSRFEASILSSVLVLDENKLNPDFFYTANSGNMLIEFNINGHRVPLFDGKLGEAKYLFWDNSVNEEMYWKCSLEYFKTKGIKPIPRHKFRRIDLD